MELIDLWALTCISLNFKSNIETNLRFSRFEFLEIVLFGNSPSDTNEHVEDDENKNKLHNID